MKLRCKELCPIHRSISCCGRDVVAKPKLIRFGVQRIEDPHHPRGYRELRSPAEMRKLLKRKIVEQNGICALCHEEFTDYNDVVPDHKSPKGMGGAFRDDHPDNIRQRTIGAMEKRDQPGWASDGRLDRQRFVLAALPRVVNNLPRVVFSACVAKRRNAFSLCP